MGFFYFLFLRFPLSLMTAPHLLCTFLVPGVTFLVTEDALSSSPSWARSLLLSAVIWWARNCRALLNLALPCTG